MTINAGETDAAVNTLLLNVLATDPGVDVADDDNDGIPNADDADATGTIPTELQLDNTGGDTLLVSANTSAPGLLTGIGDAAFAAGATGQQ